MAGGQLRKLSYFDDLSVGITYEEAVALPNKAERMKKVKARAVITERYMRANLMPTKTWDMPENPRFNKEVQEELGTPLEEKSQQEQDKEAEKERNPRAGAKHTFLGLGLDMDTDRFTFNKSKIINLTKARRGVKKPEFDCVNRKEAEEFLQKNRITKAQFLGLTKSLFDPTGFLLPIETNLRLAYRALLLRAPGMLFKEKVPVDLHPQILDIMESILHARQTISLPRATTPPLEALDVVVGRINAGDACVGHAAAAACHYLHYQFRLPNTDEEKVLCFLLWARCKINSLIKSSNQVLDELKGARLNMNGAIELNTMLPLIAQRELFLSDSGTLCAMLRKGIY